MTQDAGTGVAASEADKRGKDDDKGAADLERMVPLAALDAERKARQRLETELARVSGTVEGLKAGQPKPESAEPRVYTRSELRGMVNEGKITEDRMDEVLEQQAERRVTARTESLVESKVTGAKTSALIEAEIDRYAEAHPDLREDGSETRGKVQAEFNRLVKRGLPSTLATELTAIENALGPVAAPKGRRRTPETTEETGGNAGTERGGNADTGWSKGLTPRQKDHYSKLVTKGVYKGFNDAKLVKELGRIRKAN